VRTFTPSRLEFGQSSSPLSSRVLRKPYSPTLSSMLRLPSLLCPLQFSPPGRLVTQESLSSFLLPVAGISPRASRRTPDVLVSKHPARQLPLLPLWPVRISRRRIRFERFPCRPSSCTELSSARLSGRDSCGDSGDSVPVRLAPGRGSHVPSR